MGGEGREGRPNRGLRCVASRIPPKTDALSDFRSQPQNLVLTGDFPNCEVKLCDFGISRYLSEGADVREILGTPDYVGEYWFELVVVARCGDLTAPNTGIGLSPPCVFFCSDSP